jgi:hypothetical protein
MGAGFEGRIYKHTLIRIHVFMCKFKFMQPIILAVVCDRFRRRKHGQPSLHVLRGASRCPGRTCFLLLTSANNALSFQGYSDVASVFRSTAEGETGHAHGHLEFLQEVCPPASLQLFLAACNCHSDA